MVPVFIGGCERSGTTLLGAMLGTNSECLWTPKSQFKIDALCSFEWSRNGVNIPYALNVIKNHQRFKLGFDINLVSMLPEEIEFSYPELIKWIVKRYGEKHGKSNPKMWIDHTPTNLVYANILFDLFPEAKMIHIVRDGRAVAASLLMHLDWRPNTINKAAHFWIEKVSYGLGAESFWGEERVRQVRYEDLVEDPEKTLKTLCCWLNIDYQSEMIKGSGFIPPEYTSEQHALVGRPLSVHRISAWEKELTPQQVEIFETITGDFLLYLGYVQSMD